MQTFVMLCFTFLCLWLNFNYLTFLFILVQFLQFLLLHLGTDKWMCSLMRNILLCDHLSSWKTIKFPLIWYIIYGYFFKSCMKDPNLKQCLLSFFAECIIELLLWNMFQCICNGLRYPEWVVEYNNKLSTFNFQHTFCILDTHQEHCIDGSRTTLLSWQLSGFYYRNISKVWSLWGFWIRFKLCILLFIFYVVDIILFSCDKHNCRLQDVCMIIVAYESTMNVWEMQTINKKLFGLANRARYIVYHFLPITKKLH